MKFNNQNLSLIKHKSVSDINKVDKISSIIIIIIIVFVDRSFIIIVSLSERIWKV